MKISLSICMHGKVILPMILTVLVIGVIQFAFAEELEKGTYVAVDEEKVDRPKSTYDPQEITITGHIADYNRGQNVIIIIINPNGSEEEINTFASKKGDIYTLLYITWYSEVGKHEVILKYKGEEIASTSFEILESQ